MGRWLVHLALCRPVAEPAQDAARVTCGPITRDSGSFSLLDAYRSHPVPQTVALWERKRGLQTELTAWWTAFHEHAVHTQSSSRNLH